MLSYIYNCVLSLVLNYISVCVRAHVHARAHAYMHARALVPRTCIHACTCFGAHMYSKNVGGFIYIYIYIYIYTQLILAYAVHGAEMWCLMLR